MHWGAKLELPCLGTANVHRGFCSEAAARAKWPLQVEIIHLTHGYVLKAVGLFVENCPLHVSGHLIFQRQNFLDKKRCRRPESGSWWKWQNAWRFFFKRNLSSHGTQFASCKHCRPILFPVPGLLYKNGSNTDFLISASGLSQLRR